MYYALKICERHTITLTYKNLLQVHCSFMTKMFWEVQIHVYTIENALLLVKSNG